MGGEDSQGGQPAGLWVQTSRLRDRPGLPTEGTVTSPKGPKGAGRLAQTSACRIQSHQINVFGPVPTKRIWRTSKLHKKHPEAAVSHLPDPPSVNIRLNSSLCLWRETEVKDREENEERDQIRSERIRGRKILVLGKARLKNFDRDQLQGQSQKAGGQHFKSPLAFTRNKDEKGLTLGEADHCCRVPLGGR